MQTITCTTNDLATICADLTSKGIAFTAETCNEEIVTHEDGSASIVKCDTQYLITITGF